MLRHGKSWVTVTCTVLFSIWLLLLLISGDSISREMLSALVALLFVVSLIAALLLDLICMSASLGSIEREVVSGHWDLLCVTLLRIDQIVAAKHGVAQTHAWRLTMLLIGVRAAISLMILASFILLIQHDYAFSYYFPSTSGWLLDLLTCVVILLACVVYTLEPLGRMRAVTAIGIAISTRTRQPFSLLAGFAAIMALWIVQGFIIMTIALFASVFFVPLGLLLYSSTEIFYLSRSCHLVLLRRRLWVL